MIYLLLFYSDSVVCPPVRLSSGAEVPQKCTFYRCAELHFEDYAAWDAYCAWFKANPIPQERTPAGKSAFKFYILADTQEVTRSHPDVQNKSYLEL